MDTRVRRQPHRAHYDRATIDAILDAVLVAHVAFVDAGDPVCVPLVQARIGDRLYVHGSTASRALRTLAAGAPACLAVTAVDGLVCAASAFEHSVNYRSVMIFGSFREVREPAAYRAFTEKLLPGRWDEVRPPSRAELRASTILAMSIDAASAKVRAGPPDDAGPDHWAGVVPLTTSYGEPEPANGLPLADSVRTLLER